LDAEEPHFDTEDFIVDYVRFVCTPIPDVQKRLETEEKAMKAEMSNLDKKEDYLEMTYKNSKNALEQALKGQS
jgi:prefoldin subunit 1